MGNQRRTFNRTNVSTEKDSRSFERKRNVRGCLPEVAKVFNENTELRLERNRLFCRNALLEERCRSLELENAKLHAQLNKKAAR